MSGTKADLKTWNKIDKLIRRAMTDTWLIGEDFYKRIGSKGGKWCGPKGFALDPERAKNAGRKGGLISKRGKAKK